MSVDGRHAIRLRIRGRVQGVWYRGWMVDEARARGLAGWVRNRRDGSVEALIVGPEADLRDMIASCGRGPRLARVEDIEQAILDRPYTEEFDFPGFGQRPTA
ncbi:MAG: acylphosphatase [Alphaproteobacteria bacterium]